MASAASSPRSRSSGRSIDFSAFCTWHSACGHADGRGLLRPRGGISVSSRRGWGPPPVKKRDATMWKELKPAFLMMVVMTILTGLVYPAVVTGLAQAMFHDQANGSLIVTNGQVIGSRLTGQ